MVSIIHRLLFIGYAFEYLVHRF